MTFIVRGTGTEGQARPPSGSAGHTEGLNTIASGSQGSHAEGKDTIASGGNSHAEGSSSTASGSTSHAEGQSSTASGGYTHAGGYLGKATRFGEFVRGGGAGSATGATTSQHGSLTIGALTTDATPTVLTADAAVPNLAAAGSTVLTLVVKAIAAFQIVVVARRVITQGSMAGFTIEGIIGRDSTGNARIIGTPTTASWADAGATTWTMVASVDTTNATYNFLALTVTGEAAKSISWFGTIHITEIVTSN